MMMMITRSSASKLRNRKILYNIPSSMPCFKSSSTFTTNTKSMDDNVGTIHNNDPENNNNSNNPKVLPSLLESLEDDDRMVAEGKTNSGITTNNLDTKKNDLSSTISILS